jgi:RNA polymerase sigma-70 factor, ECF subfamily
MYREMGLANTSPRASQDDATLLALVRRGDEHAMSVIYDRYSRVVYSVALRVLRDPASAEEILQEVFLHVWRTPERFVAVRGSFGAWLTVIVRNRSIDALRRKKPIDTIDELSLTSHYDLASEAERNTMAELARAVIVKLPPDQRKTLEMAFFDGLTHTEIAEMTADPPGTVKTRIRSALISLRKAFLA